jgi:hypothetical protein
VVVLVLAVLAVLVGVGMCRMRRTELTPRYLDAHFETKGWEVPA